MGNIAGTPHEIGERNRAHYLGMIMRIIRTEYGGDEDIIITAPRILKGRWERNGDGTIKFNSDSEMTRQGTEKLRQQLRERKYLRTGKKRRVQMTADGADWWKNKTLEIKDEIVAAIGAARQNKPDKVE